MTDQERYEQAVAIVTEAQQCSVSMLQRRMRIGYSAAAKLVDQMEAAGVVGPYEGSKPRTVIAKPEAKPKTRKQKPADKPAGDDKKPVRTKTPPKAKKPQKAKQKPETTPKPKKENKRPPGRPRAWFELNMPSKLDAVRGWAMQGATMVELAEMLGVSETTVYEWQREFPKFAEAVRAGRHIANGELLNAAFRASTGFHSTGKAAIKVRTFKAFNVTDPKTGQTGEVLKAIEEVVMVDVSEYVPPNAQLLQFMLTNRMPGEYKKKEHIEHGGTVGGGGFSYLTDEELDAELAALENGGGNV